ncbi:MAG TPA: radical SAM protein, partial [Caldilineae bacterium]|nr:radical SAM protein [Caldilineae bacterium]
MTEFTPAYVYLLHSGEFGRRMEQAYDLLSRCDVCAWHCPVDRRAGKLGVCKTGVRAKISSYGPHLGEEDPL